MAVPPVQGANSSGLMYHVSSEARECAHNDFHAPGRSGLNVGTQRRRFPHDVPYYFTRIIDVNPARVLL